MPTDRPILAAIDALADALQQAAEAGAEIANGLASLDSAAHERGQATLGTALRSLSNARAQLDDARRQLALAEAAGR